MPERPNTKTSKKKLKHCVGLKTSRVPAIAEAPSMTKKVTDKQYPRPSQYKLQPIPLG